MTVDNLYIVGIFISPVEAILHCTMRIKFAHESIAVEERATCAAAEGDDLVVSTALRVVASDS
jgi:hypothetical protein